MNRREFMSLSMAAVAGTVAADATVKGGAAQDVRAVLLHLGQNMWGEYLAPGEEKMPGLQYTAGHLRTDENVWRALTARMQARAYNMAVIDI